MGSAICLLAAINISIVKPAIYIWQKCALCMDLDLEDKIYLLIWVGFEFTAFTKPGQYFDIAFRMVWNFHAAFERIQIIRNVDTQYAMIVTISFDHGTCILVCCPMSLTFIHF